MSDGSPVGMKAAHGHRRIFEGGKDGLESRDGMRD